MRRLSFFIVSIAVFLAAHPDSADAQTVLKGGNVHTVSGDVVEDGVVVISEDGTIAAVGDATTSVPSDAEVIDVSGRVVTPGLVEARTYLGLVEIWAVGHTRDIDPGGDDPIRAAFRAADAFNSNSAAIPIARAGGVTSVVVTPSGGLVSGRLAWADLGAPDGTRPTHAQVIDELVAMRLQYGFRAAEATGGSRGGALEKLRELYDDVVFYRDNRQDYDQNRARTLSASRLDLEALIPTLDGTMPVFVDVDRAADINAVLDFAGDVGFNPVIVGGAEAWMVRDRLAEEDVPVIVDPTNNLPSHFEHLGARSDNAALLEKAEVDVILSTFHTHNVRNLRQYAGIATRAGLPHDAALEAVTLAPARAAGLANSYGSLDPGKVANVVVWSGDPFELSTDVEHVFIHGEEVSLDHRQRELFERYKTLEGRAEPAPRKPSNSDAESDDESPANVAE